MATRRIPTRTPTGRSDESALDIGALRQVLALLEGTDVTHLVWTRGDERLDIRRGAGGPFAPSYPPVAQLFPVPHAASPSLVVPPSGTAPNSSLAPSAPAKPGQVITSPFVGTFYRSPAPDQPPFVEVGTAVKKGQVLCIVEAMKLMNEIEAEVAGKVAEIFAENGQPVEFGQALFRVEP